MTAMKSDAWDNLMALGDKIDVTREDVREAIKKVRKNKVFKAVLSTTVLPVDGIYVVVTWPPGEIPDIRSVSHYIGHPATRDIVESLGAVPAESKLFKGLEVGERAVCFPIQQGKSKRAENGFTVDQDVNLEDLSVRIITRLG
ncbi:hypothetical protein MTAT_20080 [Moorella thermoacetica]|uniref:Uncharacterized protein n=1 Tax=Neomoorella thermoacetica TaxID=1525 RepID=A0AAC9HJ24_NEOTH|nr:hypothetical protein [Moorella thermoacetica]AOQ24663.1 hypothetical protein Maut_02235 [Moorella thermoacetica]TYL12766.1 hypothetical protein MTAT_20080 [Moorella thermoacetica]